MISITFDIITGIAKFAVNPTIVVGADVPVRLTFSAAPGSVGGIQLALGTDAAPPVVLAYTEDFAAENATTRTALLDASDTRLAAFMSGKGPSTVNLEVVCLLDGVRQAAPHLAVTVQPAIIAGPVTAEGGPVYLTDTQIAAIYAPKTGVVSSVAGLTGAVTASGLKTALAITIADVAALQSTLNAKAPLASPVFTGTPAAPTADPAISNTQLATTGFVHAVVTAVIGAAPGALDTLKELADAIGDDANFAGTVTTGLAAKLAKAANLSDLVDAAAARGNLGLGSASTIDLDATHRFVTDAQIAAWNAGGGGGGATLRTVANAAARYALTSPPVIAGDIVFQTDTNRRWLVCDVTALSATDDSGYQGLGNVPGPFSDPLTFAWCPGAAFSGNEFAVDGGISVVYSTIGSDGFAAFSAAPSGVTVIGGGGGMGLPAPSHMLFRNVPNLRSLLFNDVYLISVRLLGGTMTAAISSIHVDVSTNGYGGMDAAALNQFFTDLPADGLGKMVIIVTNNPGAGTCDPTIATAKGYAVTT